MDTSDMTRVMQLAQAAKADDKLRAFLDKGLLEDLFIADPTKVDRHQLRKVLGLSPLAFEATVDAALTLQQLIAAARFNWVNGVITPATFQFSASGTTRFRFELIEPEAMYTPSPVAAELVASKGWKPATLEAGLAFAAEYPQEQLRMPIPLLGSLGKVKGLSHLCLLGSDDGRRFLTTTSWSEGWQRPCAFLGMQEVPAA
jgi:hypothetical protein